MTDALLTYPMWHNPPHSCRKTPCFYSYNNDYSHPQRGLIHTLVPTICNNTSRTQRHTCHERYHRAPRASRSTCSMKASRSACETCTQSSPAVKYSPRGWRARGTLFAPLFSPSFADTRPCEPARRHFTGQGPNTRLPARVDSRYALRFPARPRLGSPRFQTRNR